LNQIAELSAIEGLIKDEDFDFEVQDVYANEVVVSSRGQGCLPEAGT
jgi:hypothetical protein